MPWNAATANYFINLTQATLTIVPVSAQRTEYGEPPSDGLIVQQVCEKKLGLKHDRERQNNRKEAPKDKEEESGCEDKKWTEDLEACLARLMIEKMQRRFYSSPINCI